MITAALVFAYFAVLMLIAEMFHVAIRHIRRRQERRSRIAVIEASRAELAELPSLWRQRRAPLRPYDWSKDGV